MTVPSDNGRDDVPAGPVADAATARIRRELAALPEIPMPAEVSTRIRSTLHQPATDWTRAPLARPRRTNAPLVRRAGEPAARGPWARRVGPLLAAAVLVGVVGAVLVGSAGNGNPQPVGSVDDLRAAGSVAFGQDGAGELADPVRRAACLTRAGVAEPGAALVGGSPHVANGTPGTLLVLGDRQVGRYRLVVVDGSCRTLAEATVGR